MNGKKIVLIISLLGIIASMPSFFWSYSAFTKVAKQGENQAEYHPEHAKTQRAYRKNIINVSLSVLAFLVFLAIFLGAFFIKKSSHWWFISLLIAFFGLIELFFVWNLIYTNGYYYFQEVFTPIESKIERDALLEAIKRDTIAKPFIAIPTGIYIEHLFFARKDNNVYPGIIANGIIWQRYTKDIPETIERGIILPDANELAIKKIFHTKNENEEIIGWQFRGCSIFQRFDLSSFPFDYRHVKIQLLHTDFEKNVILVPDFESYENPSSQLIGLSSFLSIPHWLTYKSFFGVALQNFGTNFGSDKLAASKFPHLFFYIMTHRKLWDNVGIYFILLFVIAIILFVVLLAFLRHETLTNLLGFSTIGVLGVCTSLLFVLISSHIEMRSDISIDGTAYLEYIFAVLYFVTIFIAFNGILFALSDRLTWLHFKENLIIKLLYWPSVIYSILLVTLLKFY